MLGLSHLCSSLSFVHTQCVAYNLCSIPVQVAMVSNTQRPTRMMLVPTRDFDSPLNLSTTQAVLDGFDLSLRLTHRPDTQTATD